ncbi:hypothetical protein ACFLQ1_01610 [Candidatus Auribacterota bacterium]
MQKSTIIIIILISLVSYNVCATYAGIDDVTIHGFISQGYLKSTNNNFIIKNSTDGSAEFNEAGLNFSTEITDNLRGGLQLFSRDLGDIGNNEFKLDWGFLEYSLKDEIGLRFGKVKPPFGFYNQGRDVDLLRTYILLPQSVYMEDLRDIFVGIFGVNPYGTLSLGSAGSLEYNIGYGFTNVDDDLPFMVDLLSSVLGTIPSSVKTDLDYALGGGLRWDTPIQGLKLGISYAEAELSFDYKSTILNSKMGLKLTDWYVYSLEYVRNNLTLIAELSQNIYSYTNVPVIGVSKAKLQGYYAQISYQFFDWLETGTYYSVYYADKDDKDGNRYKILGLPDYRAWQKDWAIFTRFDITDNWLLKLEIHFLDGVAQTYSLYNMAGFKRKSKLYTVKTTFNF